MEVFPVRVPLKKPAKSAHGPISDQESVLVRMITATGEYGMGAIEPVSGYDEESGEEIVDILENQLAPIIIGEDPFQVRKITEKMDSEIAGHPGSKAIVEMALFDLMGKTLGVPVHALFGGRMKDVVYLNGWIGILEPEDANREAKALLEKGFRSVKVKINSDLAAASKRVEAVRTAVQNKMEIRVDANESLNLEQAADIAARLKPFDVLYLEQPFPRERVENFAALSKSSPIKLMADESIYDIKTLMKVLKSGGADFVKVKIQKLGGFLKTYQAVQIAEAFGVPVILGHGFGLTTNTLAEIHLAACTNAIIDGCEAVGPMKMADDIVKEPLVMDRGIVAVPQKPGIGVELDDGKLKKYRFK